MLDDLAVGDSEHVEPGRRIGLPLAREVGKLAAKREHYEVAFGDDTDEVLDRFLDRLGRKTTEKSTKAARPVATLGLCSI